MQVLDYILNHLEFIVTLIVIIVGSVRIVKQFMGLSKDEREKQIRQWLLKAVIDMESYFGSKTGKLKLAACYAAFCKDLPWAAKYVTVEDFEKYVDEALEEMRKLIETNKAIAAFAEHKELEEEAK